MARPPTRQRRDPIEAQVEAALDPGTFISWRASDEFVGDLREVARMVADVQFQDPVRATRLYETFLAGCSEKADEVDDSDGSFAVFVEDLACGWIRARQATGADPRETALLLLGRMERDPYGFHGRIERRVVRAFDRRGIAAFTGEVSARFEAAAARDLAGGPARHWGEVLRTLHKARRRVNEFIALCERTGVTPADCLYLARLFRARRRPDEALVWVRRGLEVDAATPTCSGRELAVLEREVLRELGRRPEALDSAWRAYRQAPNQLSYQELMCNVPKGERRAWHQKAMQVAAGSDLSVRLDLWAGLKEWGLLADHVKRASDRDLLQTDCHGARPAAQGLARRRPELAARLYRGMAVGVVEAGKSAHYPSALSSLREARRCYEKAGLHGEWEALLAELRTRHRLKRGFLARLAEVAGPRGTKRPESFLELARRRWRP